MRPAQDSIRPMKIRPTGLVAIMATFLVAALGLRSASPTSWQDTIDAELARSRRLNLTNVYSVSASSAHVLVTVEMAAIFDSQAESDVVAYLSELCDPQRHPETASIRSHIRRLIELLRDHRTHGSPFKQWTFHRDGRKESVEVVDYPVPSPGRRSSEKDTH